MIPLGVQASDREDFNKILHEKSRGLRSMMRSMFESAEHSLHMTGSGSSDQPQPMTTSEKSVGRLFNPFRNLGSSSSVDSRDRQEAPRLHKEPPSIVPTVAAGSSAASCCESSTIAQ